MPKYIVEDLKKQAYLTMPEACFLSRQDRHEIHCWLMSGKVKGYKSTDSPQGKWRINTKSFLKHLDNLEKSAVA